MRRTVLSTIVLVAIVICFHSSEVSACGDKFLVTGRGISQGEFLGLGARAEVLIYANPKAVGSVTSQPELQQALSAAGHGYRVVSSAPELEEALTKEQYDIVLVDLQDAATIEQQAKRSKSAPVVLPVVEKDNKEQIASAKKAYGNVLKSPAKTRVLLAVIDEIMGKRATTSSPDEG